MSDRITAWHEAAHGVTGVVFGFDIRTIVLHRPGSRANEAGYCIDASWRHDLNTDPVRTICYLMAGGAAERRLTGRTSPRDASDRALAAGIGATICGVDDQAHPRVVALVERAETMARALMYDETIWRAIERVATRLQRTGVLTGRDVQVVLREARR